MFKYFLFISGQAIVSFLPERMSYSIAIFLADMQYYFSAKDRNAVKNNIKAILKTEKNVSSIAREVFRNFGRYLVEFFCMSKVDSQFIKDKVKIENLSYLDSALAKGKGVIFLTAHIGNWEMGGVVASMLGYSISAIALPHKERTVNDLFNKKREARGIEVISANFAVRRSLEVLKENRMVTVLADRDFSGSGVVLDFLGKKALIPKGTAVFSLRSGAAILPVFLTRSSDGFILKIEEPIVPPENITKQDEDAASIELMNKYIKIIENKIREDPSQWLMFRKFWID